MGKHIKRILTVFIVTGISYVQALSVGNIVVETALNQPLSASIALRNIGSNSAEEISASLARPADFEIADIEYLTFLNDLRFDVVPVGASAARIDVSTSKAIREPYVNFLLAIAWPNGQVLKEYTVLLDPVFGDTSLSSTATTIAEQVQRAAPEPRYSPSQTQAANTAPQPRLSRSNDSAGSVTVLAEDTLWGIAARHTPKGLSVHQTMHAFRSTNPDAFIRNNINGLKAGYQLTVPAQADIASLTVAQAVSATRRDTALWSGGTAAQTDNSIAVRNKPAAELQLAAADDNPSAVAAEEFDALASQNNDLRSRVDSLEGQVQDLNRLLELKNKQLALLQQQASQLTDEGQTSALVADDLLATTDEISANENNDTAAVAEPSHDNGSELSAGEAAANQEHNAVAELVVNQTLRAELPQNFQPVPALWQQAPLQLGVLGAIALFSLALLWFRRRTEDDAFVVEDADVVLEQADEDEEIIDLHNTDDEAFNELERLSEQFKIEGYDVAIANLETAVAAQAHRADLRLLLLQKSAEVGDKDRFMEHYRFLEAIAKPEDLQTAQRILTAARGSTEWLDSEVSTDDFFKEIVHEAELTDEIEALLNASEGEASLDDQLVDDFDFESLDDEPSLDEALSLDETDESTEVSALAEFDDVPDVLEELDEQPLDFEQTVVMAAAQSDAEPELDSSDDSLDFDFDFDFDSDSGSESTAAVTSSIDEHQADGEEAQDDDLAFDLDLDDEDFNLADDVEELVADEVSGDSEDLDSLAFDDAISLDEFDDAKPESEYGDDVLALDELDALSAEPDVTLGDDDAFDLNVDDLDDFDLATALDEGETLVGQRDSDDDVFGEPDEDRPDDDLKLHEGSDNADDFADFSGFLDGVDEASLADEDQVATKLELGEAFIEMGDIDGAKEILAEVLEEGDVVQQASAREMLDRLES